VTETTIAHELVTIPTLVIRLDQDRYPQPITEVSVDIRWFENGEYTFHYREYHNSPSPFVWQCRWDRHPNPHASYAHVHRPPDASADDVIDDPLEDLHPADMFSRVFAWIADRIDALWD
jgi:hypothetical protein